MIDREKTLTSKKNVNLEKKLFKKFQNFKWLFEFKKKNKLSAFKKSKMNHFIELKKINGKILQTLWKPLYNMFHNEFLILRKILNDYLNKEFIRINNSSAVLFILFVWKSEKNCDFAWIIVHWINSHVKIIICCHWFIKHWTTFQKQNDSWNWT